MPSSDAICPKGRPLLSSSATDSCLNSSVKDRRVLLVIVSPLRSRGSLTEVSTVLEQGHLGHIGRELAHYSLINPGASAAKLNTAGELDARTTHRLDVSYHLREGLSRRARRNRLRSSVIDHVPRSQLATRAWIAPDVSAMLSMTLPRSSAVGGGTL